MVDLLPCRRQRSPTEGGQALSDLLMYVLLLSRHMRVCVSCWRSIFSSMAYLGCGLEKPVHTYALEMLAHQYAYGHLQRSKSGPKRYKRQTACFKPKKEKTSEFLQTSWA